MADQKQKKEEANFLDNFRVKVKQSQSDNKELLPELTRLPAIVKQIKEKVLKNSKTSRAHFTFTVTAGKFKDRYAWGSVPLHSEVTDKASLYQWICAIIGRELTAEDDIRLGDLVGKPVEIMVENTKVKDKTYQNVTKVLTITNAIEEETSSVKEEDSGPEPVSEAASEDDELAGLDDESPVGETASEPEEISEDDLPF